MRSRLAMLAACAILAFLSASPAAARTEVEFDAPATNGYSASFELSRGVASVETWKFFSPVVLLTVDYLARGRLIGDQIRVRFGSRGRVAVKFEPSGKVERHSPPRRCDGAPRVTRYGVFVGTIKLNGENGYTRIDATSVRGTVEILPRWKCKRKTRSRLARRLSPSISLGRISESGLVPLGIDPEAEKFTVLDAEADDGRISFSASATRPRGRVGETTFIASRVEPRPNLLIVRSAFAHGTDETFTFDEALSTASAAPPAPFSGTADFVRDAGGKVCVRSPCDRSSWLGPLTVDFPGAEDVPLAGESFHARLFRSDPFGLVGSGG